MRRRQRIEADTTLHSRRYKRIQSNTHYVYGSMLLNAQNLYTLVYVFPIHFGRKKDTNLLINLFAFVRIRLYTFSSIFFRSGTRKHAQNDFFTKSNYFLHGCQSLDLSVVKCK